MEKQILILLAHPNMAESQANKAMIEAVKELAFVKVIDLYAQPLDIDFYKQVLTEAKAIIFQFPFYWASAPSQLKKWTDEIFFHVSGTEVIQGKPLMIATTTAAECKDYRSGGRNLFTMDELLRPYQLQAHHSGMNWETPFVLYGVMPPNAEENIQKGVIEYRNRIEELAKRTN
ncbi:MAG: NAD(P)H-dependent oxidoreductase [Odoribacter sp.]|nr:NAD(P)H-dependent oxidoreductase [Odoribacter sp.]